MDIDTETIRRLRDALLDRQMAEPGSATPHRAAREATVDRVAPFLETLYLVMMADGVAEPAERAAINGAIAILTQGVLDEATVVGLLEQCESRAAIAGVETRLQAIGARLSADRADAETAFSLAAAVALADHTVDQLEHALIEKLAEWFGLSEKRAIALISDL